MDWIPRSDRPHGLSNTQREASMKAASQARLQAKGGRPTGRPVTPVQNSHRGMDWIPASDKPGDSYARESGRHGGGRASGDGIVSGSRGGGWNAQFMNRKNGGRHAASAQHSSHHGPPHPRGPAANKYNTRGAGLDVWSGVSENLGPAPLW